MESSIIKSGIVLKKPDIPSEEGCQGINEDVLQKSFCFYIVGKPGSGKSYLLKEILTNSSLYLKKFARILFVSPSRIADLPMESSNWSTSLNLDWIFDKLNETTKLFKEKKDKKRRNVLIIMDDVISSIKSLEHKDPRIYTLFFNRRWLVEGATVSIIVTSQKYMMLPTGIRSNITGLFFFKVPSNDFTRIKQEVSYCAIKQLDKIAEYAFKSPFNFMYIRLDNGKVFINFDEVKLE